MNTNLKDVKLPFLRILLLLWKRSILRRHDIWNKEKILRYQEKKLSILRKHAYSNSPFYTQFHAGLFDKSLNELPVLTKKELMANWNNIVTDQKLNLDEIRKFIEKLEIPFLYNSEYVVSTTSGTTGQKGIFVFNKKEWLWGLASHGRATEWASVKIGIFKRFKMAVVSSTMPWCKSLLVGASVNTPILPTLRLDSISPVNDLVKQLNYFQPALLVSYAGMGKVLAKQQLDGKLKINPEKVFTSSEILSQRSKEIIKEAWGKEPFNAYACTEGALLAADCTNHKMHLCEDLVIVEIVDQNNQPVSPGVFGEKLLITVLFSRTLPLIRYEISDNVMLADTNYKCSCGKHFSIISEIRGRVEDTIYLTDKLGNEITIRPNIFHDVLDAAPIGGWQIIQQEKNKVLVSVIDVLAEYNEMPIIEKLKFRLVELGVFNPIIHIKIIPKLQQSKIGKTPLIQALKK